MLKSIFPSLVLLFGFTTGLSAATITWSAAVDNGLSVESGSQLPQQNLVRLGYFSISDAQIAAGASNISMLNQSFTEVANTRIGNGVNMDGQFTTTSNFNAAGVAGRQIYLWAFNSTDNSSIGTSISSAFQSGVFYLDKSVNSAWAFPSEGALFTAIDLTDLTSADGTMLVNGAHIVVGNFPNGTSFSGAPDFGLAVPEPSTAGLLLMSVAGLFGRSRLRRRV